MQSTDRKFLTVLITIGSFLLLCILFFAFVFLTAILSLFVASLFSDSFVLNGIWTFLSSVRSDAGVGLICLLLYGLPFYLASKIISLILRNQDTAAKWTFRIFGYILLALCVPAVIYFFFAAGSPIPYIALCVVGGYSISFGNNILS